jgi:glycosyltransferase involved in cell wall biosynthesis
MAGKIAYIMSRFPHLPETFILREMTEMEKQGWAVSLYPLIQQKEPVIHAEARPWLARASHSPFVSRSVLATNGYTFKRQPLEYVAIWLRALRENARSPNLFARAIPLLPQAVDIASKMQQDEITHIHAHYATHPALAAWVIHRLTGISYSVTVHAHDIFVRTAMLATKLRQASFVVAISDYNRRHLARVVGSWIKQKTYVVHCGIVPADFRPRSRPPQQNRQRFEIINIGSLQPYKGHSYLIEACALLRERGIPFRCRIIGGGEEQARLTKMVAEAGLESMVELLGPQPQEVVAQLLPTADCYVQPSIVTPSGKMEGIPVALMEALACQLPVVATSISGVPELVCHGQTGYLIPAANAAALADALAAVYADPDGATQLAVAGRRLVLREFNLHANVTRLASLFERHIGTASFSVDPEPLMVQN